MTEYKMVLVIETIRFNLLCWLYGKYGITPITLLQEDVLQV